MARPWRPNGCSGAATPPTGGSVGSPDRASSAGITASNTAGSDHLLELAERSVPFASNVVLGRILAERDVVWVLENEEHLETTLSRRAAMIGAWRFRAGLAYLALTWIDRYGDLDRD